MTKIIRTDRSRVQAYQRCRRLRYLEYHAGSAGVGLRPVKLSIHLVIGLAVHAGLATLLRESQAALDFAMAGVAGTLEQGLVSLFHRPGPIRMIEDSAVAAALAEMAEATAHGVQLDDQETLDIAGQTATADGVAGASGALPGGDTPIQIDFSDAFATDVTSAPATSAVLTDAALATIEIANTRRAQGLDDYLLAELSALVEGMVRAYARRRLRPLLEQFEVLEVEREGEWKLAGWKSAECECGHFHIKASYGGKTVADPYCGVEYCGCHEYRNEHQINFMSRHDALLLDRQTDQLYLLSYKTTGTWDRRREADAQTDMQGLSEAIDVENRMAEAWRLIQQELQDGGTSPRRARITDLVSADVDQWLANQPEPPRILGVRYEYLLKGSRRKDDKDPDQAGRYVQDSPLVRAYRQDGITADDRRWATHYNWWDEFGKKSTINYRSWQKSAVWRYMTPAQWIDLLDSGQVQPGACTEAGEPMDTLAEQFIVPITVYRNEDSLRDLLEQIEAQEIQVAIDVAAVQAVKDDPAAMRSELNRRFQQSRSSCHYPGACAFIPICFGPAHALEDPLATGLYTIRTPNHPQEMETN